MLHNKMYLIIKKTTSFLYSSQSNKTNCNLNGCSIKNLSLLCLINSINKSFLIKEKDIITISLYLIKEVEKQIIETTSLLFLLHRYSNYCQSQPL